MSPASRKPRVTRISIIAVVRPPHRTPWLVAVYLTGTTADMQTRNRAIARIGAAIVSEIAAR